jgi:hypothetical protein
MTVAANGLMVFAFEARYHQFPLIGPAGRRYAIGCYLRQLLNKARNLVGISL